HPRELLSFHTRRSADLERRAVQTPPSLARQMEHHLKRENGLAGAWVAREDRDRAPGEPATKDLIEGGAAAAHSVCQFTPALHPRDRKSTRLNSSHQIIS